MSKMMIEVFFFVLFVIIIIIITLFVTRQGFIILNKLYLEIKLIKIKCAILRVICSTRTIRVVIIKLKLGNVI